MPVTVRDRSARKWARAHVPIMTFFAVVMPIAALAFTGADAALKVLAFAAAYAVFTALLVTVLDWPLVVSADVDETGVRGYRFPRRRFEFSWGDVSRASPATPKLDLLLWVPGNRCRFAISGDLTEIDAVMALAREGIAADRWRPVKTARSSESSAGD